MYKSGRTQCRYAPKNGGGSCLSLAAMTDRFFVLMELIVTLVELSIPLYRLIGNVVSRFRLSAQSLQCTFREARLEASAKRKA
jgi:hypothetical protein